MLKKKSTKKVEESVENVVEEVVPEKEFTSSAFDIVFEADKKRYMLVTVGYSENSKDAKVLKREVLCDNNRALALYLGKRELTKKIFGLEDV